uniref:Uncharacterized protein n=1 Tax=Anguilla anguilla TaxID=7936 RepID=A0A0E9VLP1_ANGAN
MPGHALKGLNYSLVRMINLLFNDLIIIDLAQNHIIALPDGLGGCLMIVLGYLRSWQSSIGKVANEAAMPRPALKLEGSNHSIVGRK